MTTMTDLDFVITPYTVPSKPVNKLKLVKPNVKRKPKVIIVKPTLPKGLLPMKDLDLALEMLRSNKVNPNIDSNMLALAKWFVTNKKKSRLNFIISLELAYYKITKTQVKQLLDLKRNLAMTIRDNEVKSRKRN
jgi:hypothetical protein